MNNILITTECVADLPESIYKSGDVDVIYFDIMTEKGQFRDTVEVDSTNIVEGFEEKRKVIHLYFA